MLQYQHMKMNRVGLGTYPFSGVYHPISWKEAKNITRLFIDNGGHYIDTAPVYGFGQVELLLGEILRNYPRENFYIATKCGYVDVEGKTFQTVQKSTKFDDVIRECERSLKRLHLDHIDLYFVHWPDPNTPFEETIKALSKLKKDGKIGEIGVSNVTLDDLREFNKTGQVAYVQNRFSILHRSISQAFAGYMLDHAIKLVPYHIIDRGLLTGKIFESDNDLFDKNNPIIVNWIKESLFPISKRLGITLGQLSIAWALHCKYTGFVNVGLTNSEYIAINLKANSIVLSDEVLSEIDTKYKELEATIQSKYGKSIRAFRGLA